MRVKSIITERELWSGIQEEHAARQLLFVDFPGKEYWHVYLDLNVAELANEELEHFILGRPGSVSDHGRWSQVVDPAHWKGYFMPLGELERLGGNRVKEVAEGLAHRKNYFRWADYLKRTISTKKDTPLVLSGLWQYLLFYNGMLHRARGQGVRIERLFQDLPEETKFANRLPGAQALELLLYLCRKPFSMYFSTADYEGRLQAAWPEVKAFFAEHGRRMELHFAGGNTDDTPRIREAFFELCHQDIPYVALQTELGGKGARPQVQRKGQGAKKKPITLPERLRQFAQRIGLLERIRSVNRLAPAAAPNFGPSFQALAEGSFQKWYGLSATELSKRIGQLSDRKKYKAEKRWQEQHRRYLDHLTAPVLYWYWGGEELFCAWNAAPVEIAGKAAADYTDRQELIAREVQELEVLLFRLQGATSTAFIKKLDGELSLFETATARRRWKEARKAQLAKIQGKKRYRSQRMQEFGIDSSDLSEFKKEIWLDEMLLIEEEVRPYLAYVRRAFQAALPIGTTIEFNPYRHRHDGIEFDPETLQDADKWLRGEVMKTLRSRKDYAPITQVNTLCLDYSRSMTHDLMRSLFKTVFLLVMGLESRKTYDAIHFFGSGFHEVAGFENTDAFTDRKILFKVLRNVAQQGGGKVTYGGVGGTNISAGVDESHRRLNDFVAQLREEDPEVRIVESLFVLTDGQPTMGLTDLKELHDFIDEKRKDGNVAIKGVYLKHPDDKSDFITEIFGVGNAVSADSFEDTVMTFVQVMGRTYQEQRRKYRAAEKRRKIESA